MRKYAFILLMLISITSCESINKEDLNEEKRAQWQAKIAAQEKIHSELKERYTAKNFPPEKFEEHVVYTYEIEKQLADTSQQPTLFTVFVDDLIKNKDGFTLEAVAFLSNTSCCDMRQVNLTLRCTQDQLASLFERNKEANGKSGLQRPCAYLVAKINHVEKDPKTDPQTIHEAKYNAVGELVALEMLP